MLLYNDYKRILIDSIRFSHFDQTKIVDHTKASVYVSRRESIFVATVPPICFGQSSWTSWHERQNGFRDSKRTRTTRNRMRVPEVSERHVPFQNVNRLAAISGIRPDLRIDRRKMTRRATCRFIHQPSRPFGNRVALVFLDTWVDGRD